MADGAASSAAVQIEMKFGPNIRKDTFVLENEHLVEAMVRFCLENNIIVPRGGRKSVRCIDHDWVLEIRLKDTEMMHLATDGPLGTSAVVKTGIAIGDGS